ncbi:MAG: TetR/AcrR family transcriptional regulator [Bacilli bacterium]|nr:TetR/AcrR family transcriptional regulator [bacterium]MDY2697314.1 TetR/AcrR family transcriptional regulator [Bacilli bacterium]
MLPTTTKITKEMILNTAFEIAREKGFEKISNRELAKKMNCSIRPIYYQFKNVEELNKELYKKIERYFYEFLIDNMIKDVPLYKQIGINYIKFAIAENNLFKFLFMTEIKDEPSAFITTDEKGFEEVVKAIKISTKLSDKDIKSFHIKMWIFAHGIATLSATKSVKFTDEQIQDLLSQEFQALMLLEENPNNKWILKNNDEWKK